MVHTGEMRLLAAAYKSLHGRGIRGPMIDVAKGIYRRTWYVNQLSVSRNAEITERLERAGVPMLMLKGFPLAVCDYRDLGARPMEDLDLLVPPECVEEAARVLEPMGFRSAEPGPGPASLLGKELQIVDGAGKVVELHAFALVDSADDTDLWEGRVPFALREAQAFAPCPADHLLLICAHGQRWNLVQPISWIVDAAMIVRSAGDGFDWDRLLERARARELSLVAARAARVLAGLDLAVPADVIARLESEDVGPARELADRAARAVPTRLSSAVIGWDRYRRFRTQAPPERRPDGAVDWLADSWQVAGRRELVRETARRALALERSVRDRAEW